MTNPKTIEDLKKRILDSLAYASNGTAFDEIKDIHLIRSLELKADNLLADLSTIVRDARYDELDKVYIMLSAKKKSNKMIEFEKYLCDRLSELEAKEYGLEQL